MRESLLCQKSRKYLFRESNLYNWIHETGEQINLKGMFDSFRNFSCRKSKVQTDMSKFWPSLFYKFTMLLAPSSETISFRLDGTPNIQGVDAPGICV